MSALSHPCEAFVAHQSRDVCIWCDHPKHKHELTTCQNCAAWGLVDDVTMQTPAVISGVTHWKGRPTKCPPCSGTGFVQVERSLD